MERCPWPSSMIACDEAVTVPVARVSIILDTTFHLFSGTGFVVSTALLVA